MFRSISLTKAILALMLGIAFFFTACQPRIPLEKKRLEEAPPDHFALAEGYWQEGELDKALEAYGDYLKQYPRDKNSALALHRMAEIYAKTDQHEKALDLLRKISRQFPYYTELASTHLQIASHLYSLSQYRASVDECLKWLEEFPWNPLTGDVCVLMGNNLKALGDNSGAFKWWLRAESELVDNLKRQAALNEKLEDLIKTIGIEELEELADSAAETDYAPKVYHRMAVLYLEKNELEKSQMAAMALIRSTPEQYWISAGRQILESIQEELSVNKGVLGCLLPLSGPFAIYGQEVLNGIELGMGIFNKKEDAPDLELVIKDTRGDPELALNALEELANNEKVIAVIGPLSSRAAMASAKKAQTLGIPIITFTQKEGITEEGAMVFRNFLTPSREVDKLLLVAIRQMGLKRFAILYPDNSYGRFFLNTFWDRLEELGGMVTAAETYKTDETDFAEQIKKMTGLFYPRPESLTQKLLAMRTPEEEESIIFPDEPQPIIDFDMVFIPDNFQKVAMIAPQLVYHDIHDVLLAGTSAWQSPQLLETAGDYVQGAIFSSGYFEGLDDAGVNAFVTEYKANFDSVPGILAATGYDTIKYLMEVFADEDVRTRRILQEALFNYTYFDGVTGSISFDSSGEVEKESILLTISGNHFNVFR
jgi:ABC-type branched-subunit amino acid transport system substrate-binding protein/predicted negative regulator of RcsB-dependent stress response